MKEAIPELRKSSGRVVFISSGASTNAFVGWGAYGTSKAALDHLCAHLAAEEPSIISVTVSPGKVDTAMQKQIREEGKSGMTPDFHAAFVAEHEDGRLLHPDQPGTVIAKVAISATNKLSGKHYRYGPALPNLLSLTNIIEQVEWTRACRLPGKVRARETRHKTRGNISPVQRTAKKLRWGAGASVER